MVPKILMNRRRFSKTVTLGLGASAFLSAHQSPTRRLKAGHTGITWGDDIQQAVSNCGRLHFHGFETFGQVLAAWESKGGLGPVLEQNHIPLVSAYCTFNMTDPSKRKSELDQVLQWARLVKKCDGKVCVLGPNAVDRKSYVFADNKSNIVATLNETAKAISDLGLTAALHQHTGTCVMTRDEVYGVMEAVDTRYVKFGPDVGQLAKGGNDPVKVVSDFLPLVRHVHLKDFKGGDAWLGYCPLGQGTVDLPKIVNLLEGSGNELMIMAELDPSPNMPLSATQAATINRDYLQKLGYTF
jgi:inosose dehydratase